MGCGAWTGAAAAEAEAAVAAAAGRKGRYWQNIGVWLPLSCSSRWAPMPLGSSRQGMGCGQTHTGRPAAAKHRLLQHQQQKMITKSWNGCMEKLATDQNPAILPMQA